MRSRLALALAAAGILGGALVSGPVQASAGTDPNPEVPGRGLLTRPVAGKAAVAALGDGLSMAASVNRMSSAALKRLLETDKSAAVARDGHLFYADQITAPDLQTPVASAAVASLPPLYPADQTFKLHSLPGSSRIVYLDFDGHTLPATDGWVLQAGVPALPFGGSSLDASYIQSVWRIVAEKFAPFDVDVTTEDPGTAGLTRTGEPGDTYGTRVVFTDDQRARPTGCTPNGCVGIAWVGLFDGLESVLLGRYRTSWIFTTLQFTGQAPSRVNSATAAAAAAHEVGHTFDLDHDAAPGMSYFDGRGHGNWFPLMGSSYNAVGQWSRGEYYGANNPEDDLSKIAQRAPYRVDDAGNTTATAKALGEFSSYATDGVITSSTDTDTYAFTRACSGPLTATATGIGVGQSVDLKVSLLNPDGSLVVADDQPSSQSGQVPTGVNATVAPAALGAGNFYVQVAGVGRGSAYTDGYSAYGSIGGYRLTITGCPGAPAPAPVPIWTIVTSAVSPALTVPTTPTAPATPAATPPSAPGIARATSGRAGRPVNATARWTAPASNGGSAVLGYRVRALRLNSAGRVVRSYTAPLVGAGARSLTMRLPGGRYRFQVTALNPIGTSPASRPSAVVVAR